MIRQALLGSAAILFSGAVVCAGVVGWGVFRLAFGMPGVEEGTRQVAQLRPWGLTFIACALARVRHLVVRPWQRPAIGRRTRRCT